MSIDFINSTDNVQTIILYIIIIFTYLLIVWFHYEIIYTGISDLMQFIN